MEHDPPRAEITTRLQAAGRGDARALDDLFQVVYGELRSIARAHRRRWVGDHTLNTTALIHEAYLKLAGRDAWEGRAHFYATAAKAMRQILVNYAERRRAAKRGGGAEELPLDGIVVATDDAAEDALALHEALQRLEAEKPRWCRVIECRFFGGMTIEETAEALGVSPATVKREWRLAGAWLYAALHPDAPAPDTAGG
jgi:RNA polymerase sigma factor (TIGR02999 family)